MRSFFAEIIGIILDDDSAPTSPSQTHPATPPIYTMSNKSILPPTFEEVERTLKSLHDDAQRFIYLAYLSRENLIIPRHLFAHLKNDAQRLAYSHVEAQLTLIAKIISNRQQLESALTIESNNERAIMKAEHDRTVDLIRQKETAVRKQIALHPEERTITRLSEADGFYVLPTRNPQEESTQSPREPMLGLTSLLSEEWGKRNQCYAEEKEERIALRILEVASL